MENVQKLLQMFGPAALFACILLSQIGIPLPSFTLLTVAGAYTIIGTFDLMTTFSLAVSACVIGDLLWFQIGKQFGPRAITVVCKVSQTPDTCVRSSKDTFLKYGLQSLVVAKFIPGFSALAVPIAGALKVHQGKFAAFSLTGTVIWTAAALILGRAFHGKISWLVSELPQYGLHLVGAVAFASLGILGYRYVRRYASRRSALVERIGILEAAALASSGSPIIWLDARSAIERRDASGIPGSSVIVNRREPAAALGNIPKNTHVLVYCSCPNELTSAHTTRKLLAKGFINARPLLGGLDAWQIRQGQPIATPATACSPYFEAFA